ncbi:MAG: SCP2 sterol-binding domain-containing protein [Actinomycetota bacterium]
MTDTFGIDPANVTPEEFAGLIANADDQQIADVIRTVGPETVLDRIFEGMESNFRPDKASNVDAVIVFVVTDDGSEYPYTVNISNAACNVDKGKADDPRVSLTTDVVSFSKLVIGQAQGPQLFMAGKLKIQGDLMFSAQIMNFFDRPTPA